MHIERDPPQRPQLPKLHLAQRTSQPIGHGCRPAFWDPEGLVQPFDLDQHGRAQNALSPRRAFAQQVVVFQPEGRSLEGVLQIQHGRT
jgi:hypothetical protein